MRGWIYLVLATVVFVTSCRKDNSFISAETDRDVLFSSTISGLPRTRAVGTQWGSNDSIGVYMYQSGTVLSAATVVNDGFNKAFITNGNGNFLPKRPIEALVYAPNVPVDFIAFYPYQQTQSLSPAINLANQSDQPALDFMVAYNNSGTTGGQGPVSLSFDRQMVKLELKISGADLDGLQASFIGIPAKGTFDLSTREIAVGTETSTIVGRTYKNMANEIIVEWTLFPMSTSNGQKIIFTKADGSSFTWNLASATDFSKGHRYQYDVTLGEGGVIDPTPTAAYMELPVISASGNLRYSLKMSNVNRRNYSMLYDTEYKLAYWVAYPLSGDYLGSQRRTDEWGYDPDYNVNWQADLSSGYPNNATLLIDRGHQLPSGDRTKNRLENESTFYYTNMTPQARTLNQNVWARLEDKVRAWATQSGVDTMYVVTGGMPTTAADRSVDYVLDNGRQQVAKPKYYYKVLAMKRGNTYHTIGFRFNNVATATNANYMNYTKTVAEIEQETGFTFFPALPSAVKSTIDPRIWN